MVTENNDKSKNFDRIISTFNIDDSATVNFVYGDVIEEIFMNSSKEIEKLKFVDLRFLLWEYACSNKLDSIFFDDHNKGFAFDSISYSNYMNKINGEEFKSDSPNHPNNVVHDKINHPDYRERAINKSWLDANLSVLKYSKIKDQDTIFQTTTSKPELLTQLNKLLEKNDFDNTIIVLNRFESILNSLSTAEINNLNNIFSEFSYQAKSRVKFFLILEQSKLNCEHSMFKEIPSLKSFLNIDSAFSNIQSKGDNNIFISTPNKNELERFLFKLEIKSLTDNSKERFRCLRFMLSMNQPLKKWNEIFTLLYEKKAPNKDDSYIYNLSDLKKVMKEIAKYNSTRFGSIKDDDRSALTRLKEDYVGIDDIVKTVESMVESYKLGEEKPKLVDGFRMHMAFLGNPGTGKTSVARLIGEVFLEENLLSKGHFIEAKSDDFIAGYLGQTAIKTADKCKEALGGVLFIDEAYAISQQKEGGSNSFGSEAIATLLQYMENHRDDFCVIMAGYTNEMRNFIKVNPGLTSRIPENNRLEFKDYNVQNLKTIFENNLKRKEVAYDKSVVDFAELIFQEKLKNRYNSSDPRMWGNARVAEELVQELIISAGINIANEDFKLKIEHYNKDKYKVILKKYNASSENKTAGTSKTAYEEIKAMGQQKVIDAIDDYLSFMEVNSKRGDDSSDFRPHIVLSGNPGTGKTTVARKFGRMLKERKILPSGNFVECKREDLVNTDAKERFESALGGVLFIDEAYSLTENDDPRGREIVNQLLTFMENNRKEVVVVLAGYSDDMRRFLESNPGLRRRVGREIEIDDFQPQKLVEIFNKKLEEYSDPKILLSEDLKNNIDVVFKYMYNFRDANFGNAGEVEKLKNAVYGNWAKRLTTLDPSISDETIQANNIWDTIDLPEEYQQCFKTIDESKELIFVNEKIAKMPVGDEFKTYSEFLVNQTKLNRFKAKSGNLISAPIRLSITSTNSAITDAVLNIFTELCIVLGKIKNSPIDQAIRVASPSSLTAGYVGQTTPKVNEFFKSAAGRVVVLNGVGDFVNNNGNSFYPEAISAILSNIERYSDRIVVVLVDSKERINAFLDNYPSFKSIFQDQIGIEANSPEQITSIIEHKLKEKGYHFELNIIFEKLGDVIKKDIESNKDSKSIVDATILKIEKNQTDRLIKLIKEKKEPSSEELSHLVIEDFSI
jgi:SpoVK/Ycf46/Vps4 family AAA+-type ATPase